MEIVRENGHQFFVHWVLKRGSRLKVVGIKGHGIAAGGRQKVLPDFHLRDGSYTGRPGREESHKGRVPDCRMAVRIPKAREALAEEIER